MKSRFDILATILIIFSLPFLTIAGVIRLTFDLICDILYIPVILIRGYRPTSQQPKEYGLFQMLRHFRGIREERNYSTNNVTGFILIWREDEICFNNDSKNYEA